VIDCVGDEDGVIDDEKLFVGDTEMETVRVADEDAVTLRVIVRLFELVLLFEMVPVVDRVTDRVPETVYVTYIPK
jgi:hypothetical protein